MNAFVDLLNSVALDLKKSSPNTSRVIKLLSGSSEEKSELFKIFNDSSQSQARRALAEELLRNLAVIYAKDGGGLRNLAYVKGCLYLQNHDWDKDDFNIVAERLKRLAKLIESDEPEAHNSEKFKPGKNLKTFTEKLKANQHRDDVNQRELAREITGESVGDDPRAKAIVRCYRAEVGRGNLSDYR